MLAQPHEHVTISILIKDEKQAKEKVRGPKGTAVRKHWITD